MMEDNYVHKFWPILRILQNSFHNNVLKVSSDYYLTSFRSCEKNWPREDTHMLFATSGNAASCDLLHSMENFLDSIRVLEGEYWCRIFKHQRLHIYDSCWFLRLTFWRNLLRISYLKF